MSLVDPALEGVKAGLAPTPLASDRSVQQQHMGPPPGAQLGGAPQQQQRPPTSAEIDAVIAAAMANAPPAPPPLELGLESEQFALQQLRADRLASTRSLTPLMTNILPSAIGSDGRVNLFVGNLPYRVRWQDLKDLFRKAGTVLRADVSLGPDNRSRGYGNVLMGSREDAARAIDRFNGFTWQTRTLEVRPDRLPPEYEPQPHVHHKPMYGFMPPPMQSFGGMGVGGAGGGGGWHARPPHHGPPFGGFGGPHLGHPQSHVGVPAPGFNRGPQMGAHVGAIPPIGASPLAGSLTAGAPGTHGLQQQGGTPPSWGGARGDGGLTPFGGGLAEMPVRSASPLGNLPIGTMGVDKRPVSPAVKLDDGRVVPLIGRIPNNLLAAGGVKASFSPEPEAPGAPLRRLSAGSEANPKLGPPPIALNGLAGQAKDLGAPGTLVDRVVFVKNLSLATQWQDLKDLFRPAGVVIRADVATGPDGQSRGFGTVLFASKDDALNAAGMFNGHEVDGRILHVQTERQTIEDKQIQPPPMTAADAFPVFGGGKPSPPVWAQQQALPPLTTASSTSPNEAFAMAPPPSSTSPGAAGRVPWQLNTGVDAAGGGGGGVPRKEVDDGFQRAARHPGPITLPPFAPLGDMANPLSPLQTRNLPPMTPSMPGFVFNAYPHTPPQHPQFLSPGAGPFSPGLPVTSPLAGRRSPFLNAAPGAPVAPQQQYAGSAALGTPTTMAFPVNAPNLNSVGPPGETAEYFPRVDAPTGPTATIRSGVAVTPSPLNGRERLASSVEDDILASGAAALSMNDSGVLPTTPTPPSRTKRLASGGSLAPGGAADGASPGPPGTAASVTNGSRSSFDGGPRQHAPALGAWNSERRASWSDLTAGSAGGGGGA